MRYACRYIAGSSNLKSTKIISLEEIMDQETLANLNNADRNQVVDSLNQSITDVVRQLYHLVLILTNLKAAFKSHPLPNG